MCVFHHIFMKVLLICSFRVVLGFFENTSNSWKACNRHGLYSLSITLNCQKRFRNNTDLCVSEIKESFLFAALPFSMKEVFCKMRVMSRMNGTLREAAGRSQAQCEGAACRQGCVLWKAGREGENHVMNGEGAGMSQLIKLIGAKQCCGAFDGCQRSPPYSSPSPQDTQPRWPSH